MNRRGFLLKSGVAGVTAGLALTRSQAIIPEHNWEKYDWGPARGEGSAKAQSRARDQRATSRCQVGLPAGHEYRRISFPQT